VVSRSEARAARDAWRAAGEIVVFTNGCFDLLHAGHVELLERARAEGDRLIVALNGDASVRRLKGAARPLVPLVDRARVVGALRAVDLVTSFDEDTPETLIAALRPDVLVKGGDYRREEVVGREIVERTGGRVVLVPLVPERSTSALVAAIAHAAARSQ
jgi:D-beta-D-heptose 7-phosphate kinase/D-beta-D-heptose 1-phosphate adenosyltransferase